MRNQAIPLFDQYLGEGKPSGDGSRYRYTCPFCHDRDKTFGVDYHLKQFICFRASCGVRGSLSFLASRLGFEYDDSPRLSTTDQLRHRLWSVDGEISLVDEEIDEEPIRVPEMRPLRPDDYAWQYLLGRGLTERDIYYYELSLSPEDGYYRIYFPHRDRRGEIIYWVARKYLPGHNKGRKYINPGGSIKRRMLYGSSLLDLSKPVTVCEGPLSAIAAGNAVATLGVLYSKEQVKALAELGCPVLSAMDGEEFSKSVKLSQDLEKFGVATGIVPMPSGEDPMSLVKKHGRRDAFEYYKQSAFQLEPGSVAHVRERMKRLW